jgi:hypothetical protein
MRSCRAVRVVPPAARLARFAVEARAARFAARANAIAFRHGARASASACAARRSAAQPRNAGPAVPTARPAPGRPAPNPGRAVPPPLLTGSSQLCREPLAGAWPPPVDPRSLDPGVAAADATNASWDGCSGDVSSAGISANRAAISAGRYARSRIAAQYNRPRTTTVWTYNRRARSDTVDSPCVVRAAVIRAIPSAVAGPVLRPPCILHRPFAIAGERHDSPDRARALQRGAILRPGLPRGLPRRQLPALLAAPPGSGPTGSFPALDPSVPDASVPDASVPDSVAADCCVGHARMRHAAGRLTRRVLFPLTALSRFPARRRRHA